jgi:hypothetical protein
MPTSEQDSYLQGAVVLGAVGVLFYLCRKNRKNAFGDLDSVYYHGSPWRMGNIARFKKPAMFVTDSEQVASEYTKQLIMTGTKPDADATGEPTVYKVGLRFDEDRIFDTRRDDHMALYLQIAKEARKEDPDTSIRKSELWSVRPARGSNVSGTFPSYGQVYELLPRLAQRGFLASYVAEGGHQGASLAVWRPQENAEILR